MPRLAGTDVAGADALHAELLALQADVQALDRRLGGLLARDAASAEPRDDDPRRRAARDGGGTARS